MPTDITGKQLISGAFEPTCSLRFVVKTIPIPMEPGIGQRVRVLQQCWKDINTGQGEWRDVEFAGEL